MKDRKGFTLIEIIIAIAVLTVLILIATPRFVDYSMDARVAQIVNDVKVAQDIIGTHLTENNDTLPIEATEYLLEDLNQAIIDKKVFSTDGIVLSELNGNFRDTTDMSNIKNMKSKLDGRFVTSSTGIVYYIHTKSLADTVVSNTVTVKSMTCSTFATTGNGDIYVWGENSYGYLGIGGDVSVYSPVKQTVLSGFNIAQFESGGYHHIVTLENGDVYVWGSNWDGQLATGVYSSIHEPTKNDALKALDIKELILGWDYSIAITNSDEVYAWGRNTNGELGFGDLVDKLVPTKHDFLSGLDIKQIVAGYNETFALTNDGDVYTWGFNWAGELGLADTTNRNIPTLNPTLSALNIDKFINTNMLVTTEGDYYVWGSNSRGQLALGDFANRSTPVKNDAIKALNIQKIIPGGDYYVVLTTLGDYYVWGSNTSGQLGLGDNVSKNVPIKNDALKALNIKDFSAGYVHNFITTNDDTMYVWGYNGDGGLGLGDTVSRSIPTLFEFDFFQ